MNTPSALHTQPRAASGAAASELLCAVCGPARLDRAALLGLCACEPSLLSGNRTAPDAATPSGLDPRSHCDRHDRCLSRFFARVGEFAAVLSSQRRGDAARRRSGDPGRRPAHVLSGALGHHLRRGRRRRLGPYPSRLFRTATMRRLILLSLLLLAAVTTATAGRRAMHASRKRSRSSPKTAAPATASPGFPARRVAWVPRSMASAGR